MLLNWNILYPGVLRQVSKKLFKGYLEWDFQGACRHITRYKLSFYHRITLWQELIYVLIYNYNAWFITINMCSSIYLQWFKIFVVSKPLLKLSILPIFIQNSTSCMHVQPWKNSLSLFPEVLEYILFILAYVTIYLYNVCIP